MKSHVSITLFVLGILTPQTELNAKQSKEAGEKKQRMITNTPSNPEIIRTYFKTMYQSAAGRYDEVEKNLKRLDSLSGAPSIERGRTRFLRKTHQFNEILSHTEKLDRDLSDDPNIQMAIVEALIQTKQEERASERLFKLIEKFPGNQEIALYAARARLLKGDPVGSEKIIDAYLISSPSKPNNFMFYFLKAQILQNRNQKDKALEALKQCLASYRNFDRGWLLYALLEEQLGNLEEAIKGYATFLDIAGHNPSVQNHLLELLFKQKMIKENKSTISISIPCLQKAILLFEHNQPVDALKQIEECLKTEPNNSEARLLKIQILEFLGQIQQAFKLLAEWMNAQPENEIWFKTASLLPKKGLKKSDLIETFQQVERKNPKAILPVKYLADLYLRANNQQQALVYLQKVIRLTSEPLLKVQAHYQRARIYHQQHNTQAMVKELETGYTVTSNFAPLSNMLAYYYVGKGNNRTKALQLVQQALKSDPENPHYLDTLGYISYKQGDLNGALKIIDPLASRAPDDTVIENHQRKIQRSLTQHAHNQIEQK